MLGEDVEDDGGAIECRTFENSLEVELLGGRQFVVEHHGVGVEHQRRLEDLVDLALADERGRVWSITTLDHAVDFVGTGGVDQQGELVERCLGVVFGLTLAGHSDKHDSFTETSIEEPAALASVVAEGATVRLFVVDEPSLFIGIEVGIEIGLVGTPM